jgi:hypothetical protein
MSQDKMEPVLVFGTAVTLDILSRELWLIRYADGTRMTDRSVNVRSEIREKFHHFTCEWHSV